MHGGGALGEGGGAKQKRGRRVSTALATGTPHRNTHEQRATACNVGGSDTGVCHIWFPLLFCQWRFTPQSRLPANYHISPRNSACVAHARAWKLPSGRASSSSSDKPHMPRDGGGPRERSTYHRTAGHSTPRLHCTAVRMHSNAALHSHLRSASGTRTPTSTRRPRDERI